MNMKLKDFLPDIAKTNNQLEQTNGFLNKIYSDGFKGFAKGQYGTGISPSGGNMESGVQRYGIEQLYFDWLRTAYAYRRMFIQDLYLQVKR